MAKTVHDLADAKLNLTKVTKEQIYNANSHTIFVKVYSCIVAKFILNFNFNLN